MVGQALQARPARSTQAARTHGEWHSGNEPLSEAATRASRLWLASELIRTLMLDDDLLVSSESTPQLIGEEHSSSMY